MFCLTCESIRKRIIVGNLFWLTQSHLSKAHVLLDSIHLVPELGPGGVHVGNHGADVPHDGGEDEDPDEKVKGDEEVLHVLLRLGGLTYGGEGQGGPVEAVDVLGGEGLISLKKKIIRSWVSSQ